MSVCCDCKVGTGKEARECVHSNVSIFDLCKLICFELGEHHLVELETRLKAKNEHYDEDTKRSLNTSIATLMIAAGYCPDMNEQDTLKLLNAFSVRTDKSKLISISPIRKDLVCPIRNLPTVSFKCEAVWATRNIGNDRKKVDLKKEITKTSTIIWKQKKPTLKIIQQYFFFRKPVDIHSLTNQT